MSNNEYTKSIVGGSCNYSTLSLYNNRSSGLMASNSVANSRIIIQPTFNAPPGYRTVSTMNVPSCNGFNTLMTAYARNSGSCGGSFGCGSQYTTRLCQ